MLKNLLTVANKKSLYDCQQSPWSLKISFEKFDFKHV